MPTPNELETMKPGWQGGRFLDVRLRDGRNGIILAAKQWLHPDGRLFLLPENATFDGASVPDALASLGFTFWGEYWMAAVAHDCAYRNTLLQWKNLSGVWLWHQAALEKDDCDELFRIAMALDHVSPSISHLYHEAVHLAGQSSFDAARAKNPTQHIFAET